MYRENPEQVDDRQYYDYHLDRNGSSLEAENEAVSQSLVVGRSEQLKALMHFAEFAKEEYGLHIPLNLIKEYVKPTTFSGLPKVAFFTTNDDADSEY